MYTIVDMLFIECLFFTRWKMYYMNTLYIQWGFAKTIRTQHVSFSACCQYEGYPLVA